VSLRSLTSVPRDARRPATALFADRPSGPRRPRSGDQLELGALIKHDGSFTDCVSYLVIQRRGIRTAFAFDEHSRQFGIVTVVPDR
jgi:hypothetical protein